MSITLSESARLMNQFQDRIDMLISLDAQQSMREAIIQRDELANTIHIILDEAQSS